MRKQVADIKYRVALFFTNRNFNSFSALFNHNPVDCKRDRCPLIFFNTAIVMCFEICNFRAFKNGVLFFNSISCGITAIYVFTPIFTFLLFKFLFKRNASDFYHSLSVKRETLFFTFSLSALVMTLSIVAVCGLFSIIANGFILNILDLSNGVGR